MLSSTLIKWSGPAAVLAGILYIIQAVMGVVQPQGEVFTSRYDYLFEAVFVVALLATLVALGGLHIRQSGRTGRLGMASFLAAFVGTGLLLVSAAATLVAGQNTLDLFFLLGVLASMIGVILFGISVIRAKVLPRWCGVALMLGLPSSVLFANIGGGMLLGLTWIALGYALWMQVRAPVLRTL